MEVMKALVVAALFALHPCLALGADAHPRYRMEVITVADATPREEMVVVLFPQGGTAYKTLRGLQQFVDSLPQGATLEWSPGCTRRSDGAGALLASTEQIAAFRAHCQERKVNFVVVPSG